MLSLLLHYLMSAGDVLFLQKIHSFSAADWVIFLWCETLKVGAWQKGNKVEMKCDTWACIFFRKSHFAAKARASGIKLKGSNIDFCIQNHPNCVIQLVSASQVSCSRTSFAHPQPYIQN